MEQTTYSILFSGRFLQSLPQETQWTNLRGLFPHATEAELLEFFASKPLVLTHTDNEATARELVSVMADHGLDCEYVTHQPAHPQALPHFELPPPHVRLAPHLPGHQAAPAVPTTAEAAEAAGPATGEAPISTQVIIEDEDALTPRGRRWVVLGSIAAGSLTMYAIWTSMHATYGKPQVIEDGGMIPTLCALHESTAWFSGHGTYSLACSASNEHGRYKLLMSCTGPADLEARLAFYDPAGNPRNPPWQAGAADSAASQSIHYQPAGIAGHDIRLVKTQRANIGMLDGLTGEAAGELLSSPGATFSGAFGDESATFKFELARWYVNAFIFGCQLGKPAAAAG